MRFANNICKARSASYQNIFVSRRLLRANESIMDRWKILQILFILIKSCREKAKNYLLLIRCSEPLMNRKLFDIFVFSGFGRELSTCKSVMRGLTTNCSTQSTGQDNQISQAMLRYYQTSYLKYEHAF